MFITNDYARQNIPDFWEHAYLECRDRSTCTLCSSAGHTTQPHSRHRLPRHDNLGRKIVGKNLREKYLKSNFPAMERDGRARLGRERRQRKRSRLFLVPHSLPRPPSWNWETGSGIRTRDGSTDTPCSALSCCLQIISGQAGPGCENAGQQLHSNPVRPAQAASLGPRPVSLLYEWWWKDWQVRYQLQQ